MTFGRSANVLPCPVVRSHRLGTVTVAIGSMAAATVLVVSGCGSPGRNETLVLRNAGTLPALVHEAEPMSFDASATLADDTLSREHWDRVAVLVTHHDTITGLPLWRAWAVIGEPERREVGAYPSLATAVTANDAMESLPAEYLEIPVEVLHQLVNVALFPVRLIVARNNDNLRQYGPFGPYEYVPDGPADLRVLPPNTEIPSSALRGESPIVFESSQSAPAANPLPTPTPSPPGDQVPTPSEPEPTGSGS